MTHVVTQKEVGNRLADGQKFPKHKAIIRVQKQAWVENRLG